MMMICGMFLFNIKRVSGMMMIVVVEIEDNMIVRIEKGILILKEVIGIKIIS